MPRLPVFAVLAAAVLAAGAAHAQEVKPEEAVKMRQGVMTAVKWQFAPIGAVVKGERPFDTDIAARAQNLALLSKIAAEGFQVPSGPDLVPSTRAKANVWTEGNRFGEGMRQLATEAERLAIAAQSRDPERLKAQFMTVGKICKDCHDTFRSE